MGHNLKTAAFGEERHLRAMCTEAAQKKPAAISLPTWLFPRLADSSPEENRVKPDTM
jgi:hypothetical protein